MSFPCYSKNKIWVNERLQTISRERKREGKVTCSCEECSAVADGIVAAGTGTAKLVWTIKCFLPKMK